MPEYSVVVPVYNSEGTLLELYERIDAVFAQHGKEYELIFVEDGGTDNSWNVIRQIKEKNPEHIKGIRLSRNHGQHNAVFCGLAYATGDLIITIDDDLQVPPEEMPKLVIHYYEHPCDMVYGFYKKKKHSFIKNFGSRFIKKSSKLFAKAPGEGSSFRLLTRPLVQNILNHSQEFVYIDELILWYTSDIGFVPVEHRKREDGKSGYTTMRLFNLLFQLTISYTAIPLRIMIYGGFASSIITFLLGIYYLWRKLVFKVPPGYTSIIVTILFSTSLIILSLGIIGEYLRKIYKVQHKKPAYTIKEMI
jgi:polyisoprenyl-phosphate glycosyltransferase